MKRKMFYLSGFALIFLFLSVPPSQAASDPFIAEVQLEMQDNEVPLLKVNPLIGWTQRANITMGIAPRGDASPTWWTPANLTYKTSATWKAVTPWFVIYPGEAHAATNVRIKLSAIQLFYLDKKTNKWILVNPGQDDPTWGSNYSFSSEGFDALGTASRRVESDKKVSFKLDGSFHPIHGGVPKFPLPGDDVAAVFAQMTSELILDDPKGIDDRSSAQILTSVGVDYYSDMATKVSDYTPMTYNPGAGASRFSLVLPHPKNHYFAAIDPPGSGNKECAYVLNGGVLTIPIAEFENNPPPHGVLSTPAKLRAR